MTPSDFQFLADLVKQRSGIVLSEEKGYLVDSRLNPVARQNGLADLDELVAKLRVASIGPLADAVLEAMTTNESFFFRDKTPFDNFEKHILPTFAENRATKKLRIWCAAASSGQEPYSLAMLLKEKEGTADAWQADIIGTDISKDILEKAKAGLYSQFEVQRGLPIQLLVKYFKQDGEVWAIDPAIRAKVIYKYFNLLDSFAALGKFDVVFCRNVLIYFDQETKKEIFEKIAKVMPPDGFLLLGASETTIGLTERFKPVKGHRGLYALDGGETTKSVTAPNQMKAAAS